MLRKTSIYAAVMISSLGWSACGGGNSSASTPRPAPTGLAEMPGLVAFLSDRDGKPAIYTGLLDGSAASRVTLSNDSDQIADASPDGRRIVFSRRGGGEFGLDMHVFIVNRDGSGFTQITAGSGIQEDPRFSPDGTRIVYTDTFHVKTLNLDGSGSRQV